LRKASETATLSAIAAPVKILPSAPDEVALARQLLNFGFVLQGAVEDYRPNFICNYLYDLAGSFARFWESCPVLKAEPEQRASRLALSDLTGRVLRTG